MRQELGDISVKLSYGKFSFFFYLFSKFGEGVVRPKDGHVQCVAKIVRGVELQPRVEVVQLLRVQQLRGVPNVLHDAGSLGFGPMGEKQKFSVPAKEF